MKIEILGNANYAHQEPYVNFEEKYPGWHVFCRIDGDGIAVISEIHSIGQELPLARENMTGEKPANFPAGAWTLWEKVRAFVAQHPDSFQFSEERGAWNTARSFGMGNPWGRDAVCTIDFDPSPAAVFAERVGLEVDGTAIRLKGMYEESASGARPKAPHYLKVVQL